MLLVKQPPSPGQQQCFAPVWAGVNYLQKQFSKKNYLSIRNEFLDDAKGQRTGYKTWYFRTRASTCATVLGGMSCDPENSMIGVSGRVCFTSSTTSPPFMPGIE
jgi:hypothetical protein